MLNALQLFQCQKVLLQYLHIKRASKGRVLLEFLRYEIRDPPFRRSRVPV